MSKDFEIIATLVPNPFKKKPATGMRYFSLYITQRLSGKYNGKDISESADMEHIYNWDFYKNFIIKNESLKVVFAGNENDIQNSILGETAALLDPHENLDDFIADEYKSENLWKKIFTPTPIESWKTEPIVQTFSESESGQATEQTMVQNKMPSEFIENFGRKVNTKFDDLLKIADNPATYQILEKEKDRFSRSFIELRLGNLSYWQIEVHQMLDFDKKKFWDEYKRLKEIDKFKYNIESINMFTNLKDENKKNAQEFHAKVSSLSQYPLLMRHLGLIIDCKIDQNKIPLNSKVLKIKFDISSFNDNKWRKFFDEVEIYTPWTFFDPLTFIPKCQDLIADNYLKVENGYISCSKKYIYDIRADQKSFKKGVVAALNEYNVDIRQITTNEDKNTLLKNAQGYKDTTISDGISIILDYNEVRQYKPVDSNINSGKSINDYIIYANNLDIGYRIDVSKDGSEFLPLCVREIQLVIDRSASTQNDSYEVLTKIFNDEYWVAESATMGEDNIVHTDEEITRWNNWSLVCPLPSDQETVKNNEYGDIELSINTPNESSIVPLRFGSKYSFRIRTVDLCGNGPDIYHEMPEDTNFVFSLDSYKRLEPVSPVEVFMTEDIFNSDSEIKPQFIGEDNNVIIIKSKIINDDLVLGKSSIRLISPPRVTFNFAELHGIFDEFYKLNSKKLERVYELACYDSEDKKEIYNIGGIVPFLSDPVVESLNFLMKSERTDVTEKLCESVNNIWQNEYLERIFHTVILEKGDEFSIICEKDTATIKLRAGEKAKVELNAIVDNKYIQILYGKVIPKTINLIHAVQRPVLYENGKSVFREDYNLNAPEIFKIEDRDPNATNVTFKIIDVENCKFPVRCCGQINLLAEYTDIVVDRFNEDESKVVVKETRMLKKSFAVENSEEKLDLVENILFKELKNLDHSFGDTKYRKVKYRLEGVSKYEQYFPDETLFNCYWSMGESIVKNSIKPAVPVVDSIVPVFTWIETTTIAKRINSGFRIYLKGDWYLSGSDEKLAVLFLDRKEEGVIEPIDRATIPDDCEGLVSEFGKDPSTTTHQKPIQNGITGNLFKNAAIVGEQIDDFIDIRLLEQGSDDPFNVGKPLNKYCVKAAIFDVLWDHESKRFYSEININNDLFKNDYYPFLKFVIARYQENSIKKDIPEVQSKIPKKNSSYDFRFSNVVVCPQVQVLPLFEIDKVKMKFENDAARKKSKIIEQYIIMEKIKEVDTVKLIDDKEILNSSKALPLYKNDETFEMGPYNEDSIFDNSKLHGEISDYNPDSIYLEEYEKYSVDDKFEIKEDVNYNPRNDIRKRLVFTYRIK